MGRGSITNEILKIWSDFTEGETIDFHDIRFFAYLDFIIKNEKILEYEVMNSDDIECMFYLEYNIHIKIKKRKDNSENWKVTYVNEDFYTIMQKILYLSYVNI